jgi:hypothetical protein
MKDKKLSYEFNEGVVNYLLNALNRTQIVGVQQAEELLAVIKLLQNPINKEELEKEQLKTLQDKYKKVDKK